MKAALTASLREAGVIFGSGNAVQGRHTYAHAAPSQFFSGCCSPCSCGGVLVLLLLVGGVTSAAPGTWGFILPQHRGLVSARMQTPSEPAGKSQKGQGVAFRELEGGPSVKYPSSSSLHPVRACPTDGVIPTSGSVTRSFWMQPALSVLAGTSGFCLGEAR